MIEAPSKKYLDKNRIEITTSPYYHPILPIMLDIKGIKKSTGEDLPEDLKMDLDAKLQTEYALERVEELFGKRPRGLWPSEHCINAKELNLFSKLGVEWTISDEGVLANTINYEFVRDFKGYLEDPYRLLKSYEYKTKHSDIKMIFRDSVLPNLISFEYPNHNPENAANDLYDRLKVTQSKLLSSPDENHLLTIAMDGENCWENYENDGLDFLKIFYSLLEKDDTIETVLISDYLDKETNHKTLNKIVAGSGVNQTFKLWIDEPLKNLAWTYVKRARDDFSAYVKQNPLDPNIPLAMRELFICEGSDWFWWFGEPNDSGRDNIFDYIFREHLKNIYLYLGLEPPQFLEVALATALAKPSGNTMDNFTSKTHTQIFDGDEWLTSGCIEIPDGPVLQENKLFDKICFGCDKDNFYLRFYLNEYLLQNPRPYQTYQMYVYMRNANKKHALSPIRLINKTENVLPLSKEKFHNELQLSINNNELKLTRLIKAIPNNIWALQSSKNFTAKFDGTVDLKIPFDNMDIAPGETLEFMFVNANLGIKDLFIPNEMLLRVTRD